ncbi:MAG: calcium-translocating P-type ATPase, SERCA-type [Bacillota bacterium]
MNEQLWYQRPAMDVVSAMGSNAQNGLTASEVSRRMREIGPNVMQEPPKPSLLQMYISQYKDFMVGVLMVATLISAFLGEYADAVTILAIVIINATLGFIQEYRAEKSMEALKKLTAPEARVIRDSGEKKIPAAELVPGDILVLESGDVIPADARLIDAINLEIEEAVLTGESSPVKKITGVIKGEKIGLGDRKNMVCQGTVVTRGRGRGVITATGMLTEMGKIAGMIQEVEEEQTPLQKRLDQLGKWLVIGCVLICGLVVVTGVWRGEPPYRMFLAGVSLAVAAIPEGLPAIVTVALAIGVQKMIRRKAIIRKLPAVETLGCATVICSDKTGTLTQNEMTVRQVFCDGKTYQVTGEGYAPQGEFLSGGSGVDPKKDPHLRMLLKISALCNNAHLRRNGTTVSGLWRNKKESQWRISGDPTEGALLVAAAKAGIWRDQGDNAETRIAELPFDSDRKRMSVIYKQPTGSNVLYAKGAPDVMLDLCDRVFYNGQVVPLKPELRGEIMNQNEKMASHALRVLGLAFQDIPPGTGEVQWPELEKGLLFVGLTGMIDPPRSSALKAINICRQSGIKVVMVTGDHQATARAVAQELGLLDDGRKVVTGAELDLLTEDELVEGIEDIAVCARVSPRHKLQIVRAFKQRGHVVAMTGDGVNDAPAVKEADIGISMGISGTDVTKEASAMVLADDNFATIVSAVEEGRAIYDNIRKFIRYLLSCNVGEVLTMFLAALAGLPLPLLPIQILWVNLVTDGLPAMALGVDNADPDLMLRRPRSPRENIFAHGLLRKIMGLGVQIGLGTLVVFIIGLYYSGGNMVLGRTMAFTTLVMYQLFFVFDCKSERYSPFQVGFLSNPFLVLAVVGSVIMQLCVLYIPFLQEIFKTTALGGNHWLLIIAVTGGRTFITGLYHYLLVPLRRKLIYLRA